MEKEDILIMSCQFLGSLTLFISLSMGSNFWASVHSSMAPVIAGFVLNFLFYNMKHGG